jgi:asparagine synthase (glutamine-hydrolysing)
VPTYIVSTLARAQVTVALTGDGGDELFAGYRRFQAGVRSERLPRWAAALALTGVSAWPAPPHERHWRADAQRFLRGVRLPLDERMTMWNALFFDDLRALLRPDLVAALRPIDRLRHLRDLPDMNGRSTLSRMLAANFTSYLADDLLVKTDRCTMAAALEARSPFLDRELIEYAARLPDRLKLEGGRTKAILRDAFSDLIPPEINARGKMGFGVPLGTWFRGELRDYMRELLLAPDACYREFLSGSFVEALVQRHLAGQANAGQQLWSLICFERWLQLLPEWRRGRRPPSEPQPVAPGLAASRP